MKAIINVNKKSAYAKFNGRTFEVEEVLNTIVGVKLPHEELGEMTTDFSHTEVFIVDLQEELQKAYDDFNKKLDKSTFTNLMSYIKTNGFVMSGVKLNKPLPSMLEDPKWIKEVSSYIEDGYLQNLNYTRLALNEENFTKTRLRSFTCLCGITVKIIESNDGKNYLIDSEKLTFNRIEDDLKPIRASVLSALFQEQGVIKPINLTI